MAWAKHIRGSVTALALASGAMGSGLHGLWAQTAPQATTVSALTPAAVAYDSVGNLYIAVRGENLVREVNTLGQVSVFAGTGEQGYTGDGGAATGADLDSPSGIAVAPDGTVYIADTHNSRIRVVSGGNISTFAGTGVAGYSGDGGSATAAQLDEPTALSLDAAGNLYIADTLNQRIRKVSAGVITTFAGTGEQGYAGDGGSAVAALLDSPSGVSADPFTPGKVYISDTHNQRVRVVDSSGNISTLAGTGARSFSGDGGSAVAATLASPKGIGIDANDVVYVADSENQRIRTITGSNINTLAGDGEQGFAGDLGVPGSAILDTPWAVALSSNGVLALTDTHNQRVRAVSGTAIDTVAGIPPSLTEGILLSGPTSGTYGSTIGQLAAAFSNGSNVATGTATLTDGGVAVTSAAMSGNAVTFSLDALSGGLHTLAVSYAGDKANPAIASGVYLVNIAAAAQIITFPALPTQVTYSPGASVTLSATSSSGLPVTFAVTGPATLSGSTLTFTGPGTVVITATQAGNNDFAAASSTQTIAVAAAQVTVSSVAPASVTLGAANTVLTITGAGFTGTSVVEVNGSKVPTTFGSFNSLTAVLPQTFTLQQGTLSVAVFDSSSQVTSNPVPLTVAAPSASAVLTAPTQSTSAQQPTVNLQLEAAYPVQINGTLTLSFAPAGGSELSDQTVQFSGGGTTFSFIVPPNSTTVPSVSFDTGTLAGTITLNLSLIAGGVDVTPATARTATIVIPGQVPVVSGGHVSFTQSGGTLTVIVSGYSNTRDMTQAIFGFTAAPGSSLSTTSLTRAVAADFSRWWTNPASFGDGSNFTYTQTFQLSDPDAGVSGVTVQLVNSVGTSAQATSP